MRNKENIPFFGIDSMILYSCAAHLYCTYGVVDFVGENGYNVLKI